ncbi:hypothetical protein JCM5353_006721 [Sporobolomyces roseus]
MSNSLSPPSSPDSSSPPSIYRPFSSLPTELVRTIIDSTVPRHYHSATYDERQRVLRSFCLVSTLFREIVQPLLFAVARYTNRLDRRAWDERYSRECNEAYPAEDLVFLRFDWVVPALGALSVEFSGIRSLTIWEFKGALDLADLTPLSNLHVLRLASLRLSQTDKFFLPKLEEMQLLWIDNAERIMLPESLPSLRALLYSSQGRPASHILTLALAGIVPQLEMLSLDLEIVPKLAEDLVRAVAPFTLFDVTVEAADLPGGSNVRLMLDRNDLEAVDVLEDLAHSISWRPSSSAPTLLYLPLSSLDNPTSSDRFEFALHQLSLACQQKNVEIVREEQPISWTSDSGISQNFWNRRRKLRRVEK